MQARRNLIIAIIGISSGSKGDYITPMFITVASLGMIWVSRLAHSLKRI